MAMLAEPRRRKKYNLCPRGKALYEDDSRFGTKMLEKMGWSKGQGLGANLDGSQDFVRVRFKNDAEGLGYENRDDQWTVHEEGFNGLLKTLNGGSADDNKTNEANGNESASEDERRPMGFGFKAETVEEVKPKSLKDNLSGVSLEQKSMVSKARVHYKKFTRGKDLSRYSEKDLANIFGKKTTDDFVPVSVKIPDSAEEPKEEEEKSVDPNFAGVHTVSTGLSVNDYFRLKMEALKKGKSNNQVSNGVKEQVVTVTEEKEEECDPPVKKKKKKSKKDEDIQLEEENVVESFPQDVEDTVPHKKKKNKSKRAVQENTGLEDIITEEPVQEKKKKSKRADKEVAEEVEENHTQEKKSKCALKESTIQEKEPIEEAPLEKKKKSKRAAKESPEEQPTEEATSVEKDQPQKKKKSKRAAEEDAIELEQPEAASEETNPPKRKKKKKNEQSEAEIDSNKQKKLEVEEIANKKSKQVEEKSEKSGKKESKKLKKHKSNVSADESDTSSSVVELDSDKYLTTEQLIEKRDSFNICTISSFCAEKFHIFDMKAFKNSTLAQIPGYAVDDNIQLKVIQTPNDATRIMSLWEGKTNKYKETEAINKKAKRTKHKTQVRQVKRRQVFSAI